MPAKSLEIDPSGMLITISAQPECPTEPTEAPQLPPFPLPLQAQPVMDQDSVVLTNGRHAESNCEKNTNRAPSSKQLPKVCPFSGTYMTTKARLLFEEALGRGEMKSSQPKRKMEEGEIEDEPINNDYPLKVPRGATKEEMRQKAEEQMHERVAKARDILYADGDYSVAVMNAYMQKHPARTASGACVCCACFFETWNLDDDVCPRCEDEFLKLVPKK